VRGLSLASYDRLVDAVYASGVDPQKWGAFLSLLTRCLDGVWVALSLHDHDTNRNIGVVADRYDPDFIAAYRQEYAALNPWSTAAKWAAVGRAQPSESLVHPETLRKTRFYNEWVRPQEDIGTGAGVTLYRDARHFVRLSCNVRYRDGQRLQPDVVATLDLLAPHLRRSLAISRQLHGQRLASEGVATVESLPGAVFLLDGEGRVRHANRRAETARLQAEFFCYARTGRLILKDPDADRSLKRAIHAIANRDHLNLVGTMMLCGSCPGQTIEATIAPFPPGMDDPSNIANCSLEDPPIAILCVALPAATATLDPGELAQQFGLTPAEAGLALALFEGGTLRSYADRRRVSVQTVRKQLNIVFGKTGTGQQSQLVALLARTATSYSPAA
jgi:DNA-binding CsgD family transcriptional regulator/PAS domain-containing protein